MGKKDIHKLSQKFLMQIFVKIASSKIFKWDKIYCFHIESTVGIFNDTHGWFLQICSSSLLGQIHFHIFTQLCQNFVCFKTKEAFFLEGFTMDSSQNFDQFSFVIKLIVENKNKEMLMFLLMFKNINKCWHHLYFHFW